MVANNWRPPKGCILTIFLQNMCVGWTNLLLGSCISGCNKRAPIYALTVCPRGKMRNSYTKQWKISGDLPLVSLQMPLLSHYNTQGCVCLGESSEISQRGLCSHQLPTSTWKASGEGRSIAFVCRPWKKAWEQQNPRWLGASFSLRDRARKRWEMFIAGCQFLGLSHLMDFICASG